ncbi:MAG: glutamate--cysteine ligase [Bdellovibrionota bacterium]
MVQKILHQQTLKNYAKICDWYAQKTESLPSTIYSSYDIRDSGYKVTNVDANIFPAGFNNICPADKDTSVDVFDRYLIKHYLKPIKNILLVTEEHTNNPYYWENISTIQKIVTESGRNIKIAFAKKMDQPLVLESTTGKKITVESAEFGSPLFDTFKPDLIVNNNDFAEAHEEWAMKIDLPMNPPRELGWYQRKKSRYFKYYNQMVNEFSEAAGIDPFIMRVETDIFEHFDINEDKSRNELADKVDSFIAKLEVEYKRRKIDQKPFVFVKNNAGTYGLAVIRVGSGQEVREWSYKSRKKMKAAKGGREVEEVIIQEGVPSIVQADEASAEPVIYMIGCELAGGFLRSHAEKSSTESLNSPGAIYKKLCVSDLTDRAEGCPMENVYGWTAKLGLLAIGLEAQEMKVDFKGFKNAACG